MYKCVCIISHLIPREVKLRLALTDLQEKVS